MCLFSSCLEGSAVDDEIAVVDMEQVTGGVGIDRPCIGINHVGCKLDFSGSLAFAVPPFGGVDDCQRRTLGNGKGDCLVGIPCLRILVVIVAVVAVAVKADFQFVTVQIQHLVRGDPDRFPRITVAFRMAVIPLQCNIGILIVCGFQQRADRIRINIPFKLRTGDH